MKTSRTTSGKLVSFNVKDGVVKRCIPAGKKPLR